MPNYKVYDARTLKLDHESKHPDSHFFDQKTLQFFGETMSTMRLLKKTAKVKDVMGEEHECYVLSTSQRLPSGSRRRVWHYFDINTLEQVNPAF